MAVIVSSKFDIVRTLGSGGMGVVYEATEKSSGRRVALKTVHQPTGQNVYRIKQEFRALADIEHEHLVRFLGLHEEDGQWFICMELVDGKEFDAYIGGPRHSVQPSVTRTATGAANFGEEDTFAQPPTPPPPECPPLALNEARLRSCLRQIVLGLEHLHGLGRVHCDLKPSNVLVTSDERTIILDFGLTRTIAEEGITESRERLEGTIPYMAPEQVRGEVPTSAADFYALGIMLHEALTGQRPFQGSHVQVMAEKQRRHPEAPHQLDSALPRDLSELCHRLLTLDPTRRPASTEILQILGANAEESAPVRNAQRRPLDEFVGRQTELERLTATMSGDALGLRGVLLRGEPGIGKSALARAFLSQQRRGQAALVFSSRCREQESLPLKAFDGMVDSLSRYLLSLPDVDAALILPTDVTALAEVFPTLQRVPIVARLVNKSDPQRISDEVRHRAALILRKVLQAIAREKRVFLFVDDLQWADASSLEFLTALLDEGDPLPCFLLATSRPVSDTKNDPFSRLSKMSSTWSSQMEVWTVRGLIGADAGTLLEATGVSGISADRAQRLIDESEGHPLLLKELARYLVNEGSEAQHPVSLLQALGHRIARLQEREREVLEVVCLAGAPITLATTAQALDLPVIDCELSVHRLRGSQLLRLDDLDGEKVLEPYHDRIREAVESTFAERAELRRKVHRAIGQALLALTPPQKRGSAIFAIVGNLNRSMPKNLSDEYTSEERTKMARLNFEAGRRAIGATAPAQARTYIERGLELLGDDSWTTDFELSYELHLDRMLALFLSGDHEAAESAFAPLAEHAVDPKDIARAYEILIKLRQCRGDDTGSLLSLREGLRRLGYSFPQSPGKLTVIWEMTKMGRTLSGLDLDELAARPTTDSPTVRGKQRLFIGAFGAGFRSDPNAMMVMGIRGMRSVVHEGLTEVGDAGFLSAGLLQVGVSKDFDAARRSLRLAEKLYERFGEQASTATSRALMGGFIGPFVAPHQQCEQWLNEGYEAGIRQGDGLMTYCCLVLKAGLHAAYGSSLSELCRVASLCRKENTRRGIRNWAACGEISERQALEMAQENGDPLQALEPLRLELQHQDSLAGYLYHQALAEMHNHLGDAEEAMTAASRTVALRHQVFATMGEITLTFHHGLAAARLWPRASGRRKRQLQRIVRQSIKQLEAWAMACPDNQGPFLASLLASEAAAHDRDEADRLFEEAVQATRRHGQLKHEALALKQHATFLKARDPLRADQKRRDAIDAYRRYGALAVVRHLGL